MASLAQVGIESASEDWSETLFRFESNYFQKIFSYAFSQTLACHRRTQLQFNTNKGGDLMNNKKIFLFIFAFILTFVLVPEIGFASVESSLAGIQSKLTRVILPTLSIVGIAWAAFSMMSGNERAKTHMWYAIIGSIIGFGAQAIVNFIAQTVN